MASVLSEEEMKDQELKEIIEEVIKSMKEDEDTEVYKRRRLRKLKVTRKVQRLIDKGNKAINCIKLRKEVSGNITEVNRMHYCTAQVITRRILKRPGTERTPGKSTNPPWSWQASRHIKEMKTEVSYIKRYLKGTRTADVREKINRLIMKYMVPLEEKELECIRISNEEKIRAEVKKLQGNEGRRQNKMFLEKPKQFYQEVRQGRNPITRPPSKEEVERFWRNLYEHPVEHNREATWMSIIQENIEKANIKIMRWPEVTVKDIETKLRKTSNWKTPGPDAVHTFWLKHLTSLHSDLANCKNQLIRQPELTPQWLTTGKTFLFSKGDQTNVPENYRPITCLPTTYKLFTGIDADRIHDHADSNNIMAIEQKAIKRGSYGIKDKLMLHKAIMDSCKKGRNLSIAWIDFKKAFESIPHSWILNCLEMYKIDPTFIQYIKHIMQMWQTTFHLNGQYVIPNIKIQRGIFQGDPLSPILFCLVLNPLSTLINALGFGFNLNPRNNGDLQKISHLLYMDDLALYSSSDSERSEQLQRLKTFSEDIRMQLNPEKCAKATFIEGKLDTNSKNIFFCEKCDIQDLDYGSVYKYLGVDEDAAIEHDNIREKISSEYFERLEQILESDLTIHNKIKAIYQFVIHVLTYSFGVINWQEDDIDELDRRTREYLYKYCLIYKNQYMPMLYFPKSEGGLGLEEIVYIYRSTIVDLQAYLLSSVDPDVQKVLQYEKIQLKETSIIKLGKAFQTSVGITEIPLKRKAAVQTKEK